MPILNLTNPVFISLDGAGRPNSGGTVEVYTADGLFTTYATIYSDQVKTTELTNPVTLDDAGTKEIWYDVKVDMREKTKAGVTIRDTLNLDPNATASVTTSFNLAQNGSFETDSTSDGQPDSWTITPYTGSAIAISSSVATHGTKSLEFNTAGAGTGGGTATSAKFPVTEGSTVSVSFSFYATHATTTNTFSIKWYDEDDVLKSTSTVTMPSSGSAPTSWAAYQEEITVDAAATQGEIVLVGIASSGANLSSKAYFDGISIINDPSIVTISATQTLTNKTFVAPALGTPASGVLTNCTEVGSVYDAGGGTALKTKVIEIGDWDMDATISVAVAHGLTFSNIRSITAIIRNDGGTYVADLLSTSNSSTSAGKVSAYAADVQLSRETGGLFDGTDFDSTSYNRGWITITYV